MAGRVFFFPSGLGFSIFLQIDFWCNDTKIGPHWPVGVFFFVSGVPQSYLDRVFFRASRRAKLKIKEPFEGLFLGFY